ncbi:hypothetical protein AVDCRST_MAG94-2715, partial [uncultured Leptolyngbya sp.]
FIRVADQRSQHRHIFVPAEPAQAPGGAALVSCTPEQRCQCVGGLVSRGWQQQV